MPRSLVRLLNGTAWSMLVRLLADLDAGADSKWWRLVIQLCLLKKQLTWLLRNSRPILLEAFLCRLSATNVFQRSQI